MGNKLNSLRLRKRFDGPCQGYINFRNTKELETTLEIIHTPILGILYTTLFNLFLSNYSLKPFTLNNCSQMPLILS